MAEVERDPKEIIWSNPMLKQSCLELIAQDPIEMAFECLQVCRLSNLFGKPVPVSRDPHRKKGFLVQADPFASIVYVSQPVLSNSSLILSTSSGLVCGLLVSEEMNTFKFKTEQIAILKLEDI